MILRIYCVRDEAVELYLPPFFERADGAALRAFIAACDDPKHQFAKSLKDFSLWLIGDYDDTNGCVTPRIPKCLGKAIDLVAAPRLDS